MPEVNEVPTYTPPEGVHGPTLGRDLPDGCERLGASLVPSSDEWWSSPVVSADTLYWWRFPPLKVGDRVQLTGTVVKVVEHTGDILVDFVGFDHGHGNGYWFPTVALTRGGDPVTAPEWRDCADPDELAAAVAAGVEVEVVFSPVDVWTTGRWNETADQVAEAIRRGAVYRVPTSWKLRLEPPGTDELRELRGIGIHDQR